MALEVNSRNDKSYQLTKEEAWEVFDATVKDCLNITATEFLERKEEFKSDPHYDSLIFLLPLTGHAK